jgi:DNA-binding NarL/FixJ family response regulator
VRNHDTNQSKPLRFPPRVSRQTSEIVACLIGGWQAVESNQQIHRAGRLRFEVCPLDRLALRATVIRLRPSWLVLGGGLSKEQISHLLPIAHEAAHAARLAVLGPEDDADLALQWLRRGANLYLVESSSLARAASAMQAAMDLDISVFDAALARQLLLRQAEMHLDLLESRGHLTRREVEVLHWLRRGLRNADIAGLLQLSESTVEYHVSHIFDKLGVTNRTEAVERAAELGL